MTEERGSFLSQNTNPDILIPFMLQVEIGFEAQINYAKNNRRVGSTKKFDTSPTEISDAVMMCLSSNISY